MAKYTRHVLDKEKMKFLAASQRPEAPNYTDQTRLTKAITDIDKPYDKAIRDEDARASKEASGNKDVWDDVAGAFESGINKGAILNDKKRMEKYKTGLEKLKGMIESQNLQLASQQREFDAKEAVMPNWMAYSARASQMDPANQAQAMDSILAKYNEIAGTNYKRRAIDSAEPWKVTVDDGDEIGVVDWMDVMKTPAERRLEIMMNSPVYQQQERQLMAEDAQDMALKQSKLNQQQSKYNKDSGIIPEAIQQRKRQMIESGELPKGAILLEELKGKELQYALDRLKSDIEKGPQADAGLRALDRMEQIFSSHPNISTSIVRWANSNKREDSLLGNFINTFADQKTRDAVIELEKDANTLALGVVQQFKGQRPTDILKKIIAATVPGGKFTKGAFTPIKDEIAGELQKAREGAIEAKKGYNGRYVPAYDIPSEVATPSEKKATKNNPYSSLSDAELDDRIKALEGND